MRVRVLGCSGGIGGGRHTTSLLVDDDVLIDAGTGVAGLELEALRRIDHVFLTHAHLDHIACLPLLLDTVGYARDRPVVVHATKPTLEILRGHIFNWLVWPDFARVPTPRSPYLQLRALEVGQCRQLGGGRGLRALPAEHVVPAVGYHLSGPTGGLVYSGDTTTCDAFWVDISRIEQLRYLLVETAFGERDKAIALASKHLCPSLLRKALEQYRGPAELYITHLKPREEEGIMEEIRACCGPWRPQRLRQGQVFEL